MSASVVVIFFFVLAVVMLAVMLGFSHFEKKRKRQITGVLKTVKEAETRTIVNVLKAPKSSVDQSLSRYLSGVDFFAGLEARLRQSGLNWTMSQLIGNCSKVGLVGALIGGVLPVSRYPMVVRILFLGAVFFAFPILHMLRKRSKRLKECEEQLPDALDFLARSMSAGHALSITLEMVGQELPDPLGYEFRKMANEQNLGATLDIALRNLGDRVPLLDIRFFAASITLQKQTGGNLGEILLRLSRVIRERFQLRGKIKAVSAHGRLTALVLGGLPIFTMLAMLVVAPGYLESMAADPIGKKLIAGAVTAQVLGNLVIRKIIDIKV
jgi:tight adherence protein B